MMGGLVVLGVVVAKVLASWEPVDKGLVLIDFVSDPLEPHVHCF